MNPFETGQTYRGIPLQHMDAQDRIDLVREFDVRQCRAALEVAGLQKTVRQAIERRLRRLGDRGAPSVEQKP